MHWLLLCILIPAIAFGISRFVPENPNAAVISTAAILLLCLKLIETKWTRIRRGPGLATIVMWIAYVLVTAAAAVVTYRDRSIQNIGVFAVMLASGLFLKFWPNWPRVITRVVNAERNQQLFEILKQYEDEDHPPLQSYPLKRLARFAVIETGGQNRAILKLLADPTPLDWGRNGPTLSCWILSGDGNSAWPIDIDFQNSKATLSLAEFHAGGPTVSLDLEEGETFIRHMKSKPRSARRPELTQNPYVTQATQLLAGAAGKSKSELAALKREIARRLHPDGHGAKESRLRTDALALANARIDELMAYAR